MTDDTLIPSTEADSASTPGSTAKAYDALKTQVKDSTGRLVGETKRAFADAKVAATERLEQGRGLVEERPYQAVGIALLAGVILGHMLSANRAQVVYLRDRT